jgi:hypothetical protein
MLQYPAEGIFLKLGEKRIHFESTGLNARFIFLPWFSFSKDCGGTTKFILRLLKTIKLLLKWYSLRLYFLLKDFKDFIANNELFKSVNIDDALIE